MAVIESSLNSQATIAIEAKTMQYSRLFSAKSQPAQIRQQHEFTQAGATIFGVHPSY